MHKILFTPHGERDLRKIDPLAFAKPLINLPPASHRFRIGNYRVSFFVRQGAIFVERVEIRGGAYRD